MKNNLLSSKLKLINLFIFFIFSGNYSIHAIPGEDRSPLSIGLIGGLGFPSAPSGFSSEFDGAQAFGGRIKYDFENQFSIAAEGTSRSFQNKNNNDQKTTLQPLIIKGHYHFLNHTQFWTPYASFGWGMSRNKKTILDIQKSSTKMVTSLGLGLNWDFAQLHSLSLETNFHQFAEASLGGHGLQTYSLTLSLNFYVPQKWMPLKLKEPLNLNDIEEGIVFAEDEKEQEKKQAQEELDKVQKDIRDKKIPPIHFETAQAILLPSSFETLDIVGTILRRYPRLKIRIVGHTDQVGSEADNQILSQARAEVVRAYLIQNFGLDDDKLFTAAYGEHMPIADNTTEEGRFTNRRVEFTIID